MIATSRKTGQQYQLNYFDYQNNEVQKEIKDRIYSI